LNIHAQNFLFVEIACNKNNKIFNCYKSCFIVVHFTYNKSKMHYQPERSHVQRETIENSMVKSMVMSFLNFTLPYVWVYIHVWNHQCNITLDTTRLQCTNVWFLYFVLWSCCERAKYFM